MRIMIKPFCVILIFGGILALEIIGDTSNIHAQENLPSLPQNLPLNIRPPENLQDFENQCNSILQSQGLPALQVQQYCQCSTDVAAESLQNTDLNSSHGQSVNIEEIKNCAKYININPSK